MKKFLALLLALVMVFALAACGEAETEETTPAGEGAGVAKEDLKVGFIFLHDENSTYDLNFINGANACHRGPGPDRGPYEFRTNIPENEECYNAAADSPTAAAISSSPTASARGLQSSRPPRSSPMVQFCHSTGTKAHNPRPRQLPQHLRLHL